MNQIISNLIGTLASFFRINTVLLRDNNTELDVKNKAETSYIPVRAAGIKLRAPTSGNDVEVKAAAASDAQVVTLPPTDGNAGQALVTDGAGNLGYNDFIPLAQKAAASGVASLNASSLVVQNPANATATPTASRIPIANASGKLDSWITAPTAAGTSTDTSNFNNVLGATEDTVQKALDKLDDLLLATPSKAPGINQFAFYDYSAGTFTLYNAADLPTFAAAVTFGNNDILFFGPGQFGWSATTVSVTDISFTIVGSGMYATYLTVPDNFMTLSQSSGTLFLTVVDCHITGRGAQIFNISGSLSSACNLILRSVYAYNQMNTPVRMTAGTTVTIVHSVIVGTISSVAGTGGTLIMFFTKYIGSVSGSFTTKVITPSATDIPTTTTNFNNILSTADDTVQKALDTLDNLAAVPASRTISTTAPLTGGGDLSANRTLAISPATTGAAGSMSAADKAKADKFTPDEAFGSATTKQPGDYPVGVSYTNISGGLAYDWPEDKGVLITVKYSSTVVSQTFIGASGAAKDRFAADSATWTTWVSGGGGGSTLAGYTVTDLGRRFALANCVLSGGGTLSFTGSSGNATLAWTARIIWIPHGNVSYYQTAGTGSLTGVANWTIIYADLSDVIWANGFYGSVTLQATAYTGYTYSPNHLIFGVVNGDTTPTLHLTNGIKLRLGDSYNTKTHSDAYAPDSEKLQGAVPSVSASNDTIVKRHSSGYIYANYFNTTPNTLTSLAAGHYVYASGDTFIRRITLDSLKTSLQAIGLGNVTADMAGKMLVDFSEAKLNSDFSTTSASFVTVLSLTTPTLQATDLLRVKVDAAAIITRSANTTQSYWQLVVDGVAYTVAPQYISTAGPTAVSLINNLAREIVLTGFTGAKSILLQVKTRFGETVSISAASYPDTYFATLRAEVLRAASFAGVSTVDTGQFAPVSETSLTNAADFTLSTTPTVILSQAVVCKAGDKLKVYGDVAGLLYINPGTDAGGYVRLYVVELGQYVYFGRNRVYDNQSVARGLNALYSGYFSFDIPSDGTYTVQLQAYAHSGSTYYIRSVTYPTEEVAHLRTERWSPVALPILNDGVQNVVKDFSCQWYRNTASGTYAASANTFAVFNNARSGNTAGLITANGSFDAFTCQKAGKYTITANLYFSTASTGGVTVVLIFVNGAYIGQSNERTNGGIVTGGNQVFARHYLNVGDVVQIYLYCDAANWSYGSTTNPTWVDFKWDGPQQSQVDVANPTSAIQRYDHSGNGSTAAGWHAADNFTVLDTNGRSDLVSRSGAAYTLNASGYWDILFATNVQPTTAETNVGIAIAGDTAAAIIYGIDFHRTGSSSANRHLQCSAKKYFSAGTVIYPLVYCVGNNYSAASAAGGPQLVFEFKGA
ncbi:MAG: hypothetical protein FOGNACKC_00936 [Anaerolineae bacterium]|nr:hypothetical protein [Anaerolineae bacterium]